MRWSVGWRSPRKSVSSVRAASTPMSVPRSRSRTGTSHHPCSASAALAPRAIERSRTMAQQPRPPSALSLGGVIGLGLVVWGRVSLSELGWRAERLGPDLLKGALGGLGCCAIVLLLSMARGASAAEALQGWWDVPVLERLLG